MNNLEIIKEKFKKDSYAKELGVVLDELTEDSIKIHMRLDSKFNNFHERPHGGAIYSLADVAFSLIGNNQNNISVALDCTIQYHASPEPGDILFVKGTRIKQTRKIGSYLFELYTDDTGSQQKIATMMSTLYRTGKPHDPQNPVG